MLKCSTWHTEDIEVIIMTKKFYMYQSDYEISKISNESTKIPRIVKKVCSFLYKNQENWHETECYYFLTESRPQNILFFSYLKSALYPLLGVCPISKTIFMKSIYLYTFFGRLRNM